LPSSLPPGDPAPADGSLPPQAGRGASSRPFGLYVHVPFCRVRCGYCDFNTYTAAELPGVSRDSYPAAAVAEMELAARVLDDADAGGRALETVFFGGGTPTLLGPGAIVSMLHRAGELWGLARGAEVTIEANPDSVTAGDLDALAAGGVTRVSVGVQSTTPEVLRVLDRTHDPSAVPAVVAAAKDAGMQVSVDLIFGTPGETLEQWQRTLEDAIGWSPDHVSAYALIVEPGTALARRIDRGELTLPDDDTQADMYLAADRILGAAGYRWYEISNWSRDNESRSRHNLLYWTGGDWWGIGPGAHSHVGGVRWWNVKHPGAYAGRIAEGVSPAHAREVLDSDQVHLERVLLGLRLAEGIPSGEIARDRQARVAGFIAQGLLEGPAALAGFLVLTPRGRLMADHVVRELT